MKLTAYKTEVEDLYLIISHGKNGKTNSSYLLVDDENNKAIEIIPTFGPLTCLYSDNVLQAYLDCEIKDRGAWTQDGFDKCKFNDLLREGNFKEVAIKMKRWL